MADAATIKAVVIDPVLDFDPNDGTVDTHSVEAILHAPLVKARTGARIGIGEHIKDVQRIFRPVFNATDLATDGGDFDRLFRDGERFAIGGPGGRSSLHARSHPGRHFLQD